jgi:hypothetical protein
VSYFQGTGKTESLVNPANTDNSFQVSTFPDTGDDCDAQQSCVYWLISYYAYGSFDLHYDMTTKLWNCVIFDQANTDSTYFNVANPSVGHAYGFSYHYGEVCGAKRGLAGDKLWKRPACAG